MKINKKNALITLITIWIVALVMMFINREEKEISGDESIVKAFASEDFTSTNGTISAYINYGNKYMTDEDRKKIIGDISSVLGITENSNIEIKRGEASVTSTYTCNSESSETEISIITIENKTDSNTISLEQYIVIYISIDDSVESAIYYKNKLEDYFKNIGTDADISLTFKGSMDGTISNGEKNKISEKIIEALGGKLITGSSSDEMYTVYAYTDKIEDYVINGTTKSNINIAITYDDQQNKTWVYVATPIIEGDY